MKNRKFWISLMAGIMAAVMILSLILSLFSTANAASSSEIREQINQMEKDNEDLQKQIEELKKQQSNNVTEIKALVKQKSIIEQQVGLLHAQVKNMNEQIAAYSVLIADKQEELDKAEAHLNDLNEKYKDRIRTMEEDGQLSYWSVLFRASSFSDLLDRLNMIEEIAAADQRRLDEMSDAAKSVAAAKEALQEERKALQAQKELLTERQAEMDQKSLEAQEVLRALLEKGDEFEDLMHEAEKDLTELEKEIAKMEGEYDAAVDREYWATYTTPPTTAPPTTKPSISTGGSGGSSKVDPSGITWLVPCSYRYISSPFGYRWHPVHGDWRYHAGVDMAAGCPTPIVATRSGIVTVSRYSSSAGYYVTIDHQDGFKSTYMHMCHFPEVKEGEYVAAGQVIGCVGTTGTSTGNHLHFGIYLNGSPVDPMKYVG